MLFILQHIKTGEFRICLKELYANQHDPVNVTYAVLAGGLDGEKKNLPLQLQWPRTLELIQLYKFQLLSLLLLLLSL